MAEEIEVNLVVDSEDGKAKLDEFAARLAAVSAAASMVLDAVQETAQDGLFGRSAKAEAEAFEEQVREVEVAADGANEALNAKVDDPKGLLGKDTKKAIDETAKSLDDLAERAERARGTFNRPSRDEGKGFPSDVNAKAKDLGSTLSNLLPRQLKSLQRQFTMAKRSTMSFTAGLSGLRKALIATGIGAFVVALGEIVARWDDITGAVNRASAETEQMVKDSQAMASAAQKQYDAIQDTTNLLLLQGKTEEDIARMREQALDDQITAAEVGLEATIQQGQEQAKIIQRNHELAVALLGLLESPLVAILGVVDTITGAVAELTGRDIATTLAQDFLDYQADALGFDIEEANKKAAEATAEAEAQLLKLQERRAANEVKRRKEQEQEEEKNAKALEQLRNAQSQFLDQLLQEEREYGKTQEQLDMQRLKAQQKAELEKAQALKLSQDDIIRLQEQHARELADLEQEQATRRQEVQDQEMARVTDALKSDLDRRLDAVSKQYEELIKLAEKYGMDTTELEAKRQAEMDKMRSDANAQEIRDVQALARELELLNMTEQQAQFERERDAAKKRLDDRLSVAIGNQELERQVREQFRLEMERIDAEEQDSYLESRREMFASMQDFVGKVGGLYKQMESLVKAQTEAEILAAKERGASEEEIKKLELAAVERERRMAITQVLLQQAQALASGIAGATQAAAATGPAAPFTLAAYIATMVGTIIAGFAQVKNIMNQAKADSMELGDAGSQAAGRGVTQALTPNLVTDLSNEPSTMRTQQSFKAYVVASEVEGQNADYGNIIQNATL